MGGGGEEGGRYLGGGGEGDMRQEMGSPIRIWTQSRSRGNVQHWLGLIQYI
jgi:hypothetical protein